MRNAPVGLIRKKNAAPQRNFRQVSLWGGDASLTNLDLRLDVLEEEFKLPFRLVSGFLLVDRAPFIAPQNEQMTKFKFETFHRD